MAKARETDEGQMCLAEIPPPPGAARAPSGPHYCGEPAVAMLLIENTAGQNLCREHVLALIRDLEAPVY